MVRMGDFHGGSMVKTGLISDQELTFCKLCGEARKKTFKMVKFCYVYFITIKQTGRKDKFLC